MKKTPPFAVAAVVAGIAAATAFAAEPSRDKASSTTAAKPAETPTAEAASAPRYFVGALPTEVGEGKPTEFGSVSDTPYVKTVTIKLREGKVLAEHSTPLPVVIQALSGKGKMRMGEEIEEISPARMVILAPNVAHEITPDPGTDMLLLVHHLKGQKPAAAAKR